MVERSTKLNGIEVSHVQTKPNEQCSKSLLVDYDDVGLCYPHLSNTILGIMAIHELGYLSQANQYKGMMLRLLNTVRCRMMAI